MLQTMIADAALHGVRWLRYLRQSVPDWTDAARDRIRDRRANHRARLSPPAPIVRPGPSIQDAITRRVLDGDMRFAGLFLRAVWPHRRDADSRAAKASVVRWAVDTAMARGWRAWWDYDWDSPAYSGVVYIETPYGQASFHVRDDDPILSRLSPRWWYDRWVGRHGVTAEILRRMAGHEDQSRRDSTYPEIVMEFAPANTTIDAWNVTV